MFAIGVGPLHGAGNQGCAARKNDAGIRDRIFGIDALQNGQELLDSKSAELRRKGQRHDELEMLYWVEAGRCNTVRLLRVAFLPMLKERLQVR